MPTVPSIAVTFDDGPHATNTMRVLDTAAERKIKLTFFVVGSRIASAEDLLLRQVAELHEIGNHSWSHTSFEKLSNSRIESEIRSTNEAIRNIAEFEPKLFRPPFGVISKAQRAFIAGTFGQRVTLWNIDPKDWQRPGAEAIKSRIAASLRPGAILLLHDIITGTADASARIFDLILEAGYSFVTVSELLRKT